MKTRVLLLAFLLPFTLIAGKKLKADQVPSEVRAAFKARFPNAENVQWEKDKKGFEAEFEMNKKDCSSEFDAKGNFLELETEMEMNEMPANIKSWLAENRKGKKVTEFEKIEKASGEVQYEVEIKGQKDLLFSQSGEFIGEKK